jgi:CheY-like chemotaxis protein
MARVLIVEDDEAVRANLADFLTSLQHMVFCSPNGRHALETLECNPDFDLIVTDVMMPELDGRELVQRLPAGRRIPVIMISAYIRMHEIDDILRLGAERFIPKPVSLLDLEEAVEACLDGRAADRPTGT